VSPIPYIAPHARNELLYGARDPETPGELNWALTLEVVAYLDRKGLSYDTLNEIVGALELAKQEFIARRVRPYEDAKCAQNGDVY
jgi:hypothetical protein